MKKIVEIVVDPLTKEIGEIICDECVIAGLKGKCDVDQHGYCMIRDRLKRRIIATIRQQQQALIEQEQKPMREALELAKIQIEFAQSIHWLNSGEEILAKIDTALKGVGR